MRKQGLEHFELGVYTEDKRQGEATIRLINEIVSMDGRAVSESDSKICR